MARNHRTSASTDGTLTSQPNNKYNLPLHLLRVLQWISATTSLILFSIRLAKIVRLTRHATHSNGAVEGILSAAVLYTTLATVLQLCIRRNHSNLLRMLLILFDILFVVAFIVVAVLTSPRRHGSSAPCTGNQKVNGLVAGRADCKLPWGTFVLAILSTLLHALTAAFHAARDHRRQKKNDRVVKEEHYNSVDGPVGHPNGHGRGERV